MMISKIFSLLVVVCCVSCVTATPNPTRAPAAVTEAVSLPTQLISLPTPTSAPGVTPQFADRVQNALDDFLSDKGDSSVFYDALARLAREFFQTRVGATEELSGHVAVQEWKTLLENLKLPKGVLARVVVVPLDAENDERRDFIGFGFVELQGSPIVMFYRQGAKFKKMPMSVLGAFDSIGKRWAWLKDITALDLSGDGVNELAFSYVHAGASNARTELQILSWNVPPNEWRIIFHGTLVSWAGDSTYRFVKHENGNAVQFKFPWFGVFSAKMVEHLQVTEDWQYDAAAKQMVRQSRTIEPPRTVRQQINLAEELFRRGDYRGAQQAFAQAASDSNLKTEKWNQVEHAPRAFARFREGQALALLGREAESRQAMQKAVQAGGTVGQLARAFLKNYHGADAATRAWAMLPRELDLAAELYDADGKSNADLPAFAHEIFFQGGVVAAYLQQHAIDAAAISKHFPEVGALGFQWRDSKVLDWDGDGQNELLMVVQDGYTVNKREEVWLIYHKAERWLAREIFARWNVQPMQSLESVPLSTRPGLALGIVWMEDGQRHEQRFAWDGIKLQRLEIETLEPLQLEENYFRVGWLPELIEF